MIHVSRTIQPQYLKKRAAGWLTELRAARKKKDYAAYKKTQDKYSCKQIRDALDTMFSGKCAYCESLIAVVATAHIEHFRPKQKYPSLTFSWKNLLLGCPTCNDGQHKGTKFPKANENGPLIDPTIEDPSNHIQFIYDASTKLVLAKAITTRGQTAIDIFKLNSRPDLVRSRTQYIRTLLAIKPGETSNPEYAELLAEARIGRTPYHAWIRALGL